MFSLFKRRPPPAPADALDEAIFDFAQEDPFTIRDACEGIQIFGGIGSGKTSGSGAMIAEAFLSAGFGGLVLTAKPDETDLWRTYAARAGRSEDLVFFGQEHASRFNALDYERTRPGRGAGLTENLVELFDVLSEVGERTNSSRSGLQDGSFWRSEQRKLVRNAIDLLILAQLEVSFPYIHKVVQSSARSPETFKSEEWKKNSACWFALTKAKQRARDNELTKSQLSDLAICRAYWEDEFPRLSDRTRSIVVAMYSGVGDIFVRGLLRELFSGETTLTPEDSFEGKIIILDLPQKQFNEVGVLAQVLMKYCWQRAVERRRVAPDSRPVFLWIDEAQHFVNEHDVAFQTTARSSRVCTVLLTQNLPNYLYTLGGNQRAESLVSSLLGNLSTKIFHNNTCAETNRYATALFASDWQAIQSQSYTVNGDTVSFTQATNPQLQPVVQPIEFTRLRTGGPPYGYAVEAIVHQRGRVFNTSGLNALMTEFRQQ